LATASWDAAQLARWRGGHRLVPRQRG